MVESEQCEHSIHSVLFAEKWHPKWSAARTFFIVQRKRAIEREKQSDGGAVALFTILPFCAHIYRDAVSQGVSVWRVPTAQRGRLFVHACMRARARVSVNIMWMSDRLIQVGLFLPLPLLSLAFVFSSTQFDCVLTCRGSVSNKNTLLCVLCGIVPFIPVYHS